MTERRFHLCTKEETRVERPCSHNYLSKSVSTLFPSATDTLRC